MNFLKKYKNVVWDVAMIALFVLISVLYFLEPVRDGKVLAGHDHSAFSGTAAEMQHYRDTHDGERTRWMENTFSGMPTYQTAPSYHSTEHLATLQTAYRLGLPQSVGYVFMMLLGFYILLRAFDFRQWMAALGAVLWAFSSYYLIIIAAGHIWKLLTLCFIPPTIAGVVLCFRGKYLWGALVTGIFTALQITNNHVQMSYYFLSVMGLMALAFVIELARTREWKRIGKAIACAFVGGLLGIAVNVSNLFHTWQYSKETMRSKSELTPKEEEKKADQTNSGLERSYITAWSYGIGETWSLMIPNVKGGASVPLSQNENAMKKADPELQGIKLSQDGADVYSFVGQYFGEQPGTSGPVYVGAFVVFLFVLSLFIVTGPMKWCMLAATVLSILLAWGRNLMGFTDFFLDYVPMYDKFRTVASILVVAEFTIPFLGMLGLKRVVEEKDFFSNKTYGVKNSVWTYVALALTAGVCLLFWLMPDLFFGNYISELNDSRLLVQLKEMGYPVAQLVDSLQAMRRAMFTADAMRSFLIIMVGFFALMVFRYRRIGGFGLVACLTVLCLVDMWGVNKRYLNDMNFEYPTTTGGETILPSVADKSIQADGEQGRVLNLSVSTFNDNTTAYFHQSIGGYHAAKLRRYQEVIEHLLQPEMKLMVANPDTLKVCSALNMLNTRYIIANPNAEAVINPYANGRAWFVDEVRYVDNADQEMDALKGGMDTRRVAVADKKFRTVLGEAKTDSTATVELVEMESDRLKYQVKSTGGVLVFSEIYYPGWTCTVDGKPVEIGRVDYVLRAIQIAEGEHEVEMLFHPQSIETTETIANGALIVMVFLFFSLLVWEGNRRRKQKISA